MTGLVQAFGSGAMTNSIEDITEAKAILAIGTNTTEQHPVISLAIKRAVRKHGAQLVVVDPRRIELVDFAALHLQIRPGTNIALLNGLAHVILAENLYDAAFVHERTENFEAWRTVVEQYPPTRVSEITGVPRDDIIRAARIYGGSRPASIFYAMGITQHTHGHHNVVAIANLAMITGNLGVRGGGVNPLRGQNNVQGGGDMGAIPNRLPGFQDILDPEIRAKFEAAWNTTIQPRYGLNLTQMLAAMGEGKITTAYVIGENPVQSEADTLHTIKRMSMLDHLVVQDIFLTKTAQMADVVLPAAAAWCESEGTFTNSERRVQRVRKALTPPGEARDDIEIICEIARRLGHDWNYAGAEEVWDELRSLSPIHRGMTYERLERLQGIQWPCPSEDSLEPPYLHGRLWETDPAKRGMPAPFAALRHSPPVDELTEEYPIRLTTGRRLDSYNTGVQSSGFNSPLRKGETIDLSPEDAARLGVTAGERVRVTSRRASVIAPVNIDPGLRPGLAFMTFHFPDEVDTNSLTIEATCPIAGTAEYKAAAVRVEKLEPAQVG